MQALHGAGYRWFLDRAILPRLGGRRLVTLTRRDAKELHRSLADRPVLANRAVAVLSALCSFAVAEEVITVNPVAKLLGKRAKLRNPEKPRQRFLDENGSAKLGAVLSGVEAVEGRYVVNAIRLLLLSGVRVGEGLGARWEDINLAAGLWRVDGKTGERVVYLSAPARQLLSALPREAGCPFVFPSERRARRPLAGLTGPWRRIREQLGMPELRLHDLRRSHRSLAVNTGESMHLTSKLLGHSSTRVTEAVYSPLAADPAAAAAERVGKAMAAALAGEAGEVVPFSKGGRR